jgi:hypothetical protein
MMRRIWYATSSPPPAHIRCGIMGGSARTEPFEGLARTALHRQQFFDLFAHV